MCVRKPYTKYQCNPLVRSCIKVAQSKRWKKKKEEEEIILAVMWQFGKFITSESEGISTRSKHLWVVLVEICPYANAPKSTFIEWRAT